MANSCGGFLRDGSHNREETAMDLWKAGVSGIVLVVALFVIVRRTEDVEARKWAFGAVGFILGYWLH